MKSNQKLLLISIVLVMFSLACGELTVYNNSNYPVRVIVKLPDGNGMDSIVIRGGGAATYYSDVEGSYSVTAVLDEEAKDEMVKLRSDLQQLLIDSEEIPGLSISEPINDLISITKTIQAKYEASCSGVLKEDEEAVASISVPGQYIKISCH